MKETALLQRHTDSGLQDSVIGMHEMRTRPHAIWCDRIVTAGILLLIVFTPIAFGSVHPWAYSLMEACVFGLFALWMAKLFFGGRQADTDIEKTRRPFTRVGVAPLFLFVAVIAFQLVPLPPFVLRALSPHTYEYYVNAIPGWPDGNERLEVGGHKLEVRGQKSEVGDQKLEVRNQRSEVGRKKEQMADDSSPVAALGARRSALERQIWLPLSMAPDLTWAGLLKAVAYGALFVLIFGYSFSSPMLSHGLTSPDVVSRTRIGSPAMTGGDPNERFLGRVVLGVLFTGLVIAVIAFIQRFTWNGKILWFFVPYDWGVPFLNGVPRASGPFVNPDHFASYIALILPLTVVAACGGLPGTRFGRSRGAHVFFGASALVLLSTLLLSLSRSAWASTAAGFVVFLYFASREFVPFFGQPNNRSPSRWIVPAVVLLFFGAALFLIGSGGRDQVDVRLAKTVHEDLGLLGRAAIWRDTLAMIRDFPFFGVGLGAWPELFLRYRQPPWSADFYRAAHNDYLQILAESGIVGFGLLCWFVVAAGRKMRRALQDGVPRFVPMLLAIAAGSVAMAAHECLDSNLQIPANAVIFIIVVALGVRAASVIPSPYAATEARQREEIGRGEQPLPTITAAASEASPANNRPTSAGLAIKRFVPALGALGVVTLLGCALLQDQTPYPYAPAVLPSAVSAKENLIAHPTRASLHIALLRHDPAMPPERQLAEAKAALWIDPANPDLRDLFASILLSTGQREKALAEIAQSVADSPSLDTHLYLNQRFLPKLAVAETNAIETGFELAWARGQRAAALNLASFYGKLSRFSEQGALYEKIAATGERDSERAELLVSAGTAYLKVLRRSDAERALRNAIAAAPRDHRAYEQLAAATYGWDGMAAAEPIVLSGIQNGVPGAFLFLALAKAAAKAENFDDSRRALADAIHRSETSSLSGNEAYELYRELAEVARVAGDDRGRTAALEKALEVRPESTEILSELGSLYLEQRGFDRASLYFAKLAELKPDSATAQFQLGSAEEARYRLGPAQKAYGSAAELAPDNELYRQRYERVRVRIMENRKGERQGAASGEQGAGSEEQGAGSGESRSREHGVGD